MSLYGLPIFVGKATPSNKTHDVFLVRHQHRCAVAAQAIDHGIEARVVYRAKRLRRLKLRNEAKQRCMLARCLREALLGAAEACIGGTKWLELFGHGPGSCDIA